MADTHGEDRLAEVLDDPAEFNLRQLCDICQVTPELLRVMVSEGVLSARGDQPSSWQFTAASVTRVRRACRLRNDLELDYSGLALALDLMEERDRLRAEVQQLRHEFRILVTSAD